MTLTWKYLVGDARDVLRTLPEDSLDSLQMFAGIVEFSNGQINVLSGLDSLGGIDPPLEGGRLAPPCHINTLTDTIPSGAVKLLELQEKVGLFCLYFKIWAYYINEGCCLETRSLPTMQRLAFLSPALLNETVPSELGLEDVGDDWTCLLDANSWHVCWGVLSSMSLSICGLPNREVSITIHCTSEVCDQRWFHSPRYGVEVNKSTIGVSEGGGGEVHGRRCSQGS